MRYIVEDDLSRFPFWGQAKDVANNFSDEEMSKLDDLISEMYSDEDPTDVQINDLFAYDSDYLKELLGYKKIGGEMIDPDSLPDADDEANAENVLNLLEICHMTYYARSVSLADLMDEANTIQADNKLVSLTLEDMIDLIDLFDNDPNLTKEDLTDEMRWLADQTVDFLIENGDVFRQEFNTDLLREALND